MPDTKATTGMPLVCWSCQCRTENGHFCGSCGKIQPLPSGADYFAMLGLPQKLRIDPEQLEQHFHQLSWKFHPDNFVRAEVFERDLSLERSSQLNDAYRTLRDPVARAEYLLRHHGVRKEGTTRQQAPPELLEEVFELNEGLDELRAARKSGSDSAALRRKLEAAAARFQKQLAAVDAQLGTTFDDWDATVDGGPDQDAQKRVMVAMNEVLNRRSYIRNLVHNVQQELAEED